MHAAVAHIVTELESDSSSATFRPNLAQQFQANVTCRHGLFPQSARLFKGPSSCERFSFLIFQINEGSQTCSSCGARMSEYFCFKCKHFTGVDKNPFHCDKCGICRSVVSPF